MKQILTLLLVIFYSGILEAQTNTGSFLLIRSYGSRGGDYILESNLYEKNQAKIKINPSKLEEFGSFEVYLISKENKVVQQYNLKDTTGFLPAFLKASLKKMNIRYGMGADLHFSNLMADSLLKEGVYFYSEPELSTKETVELHFSGTVNFPLNIKVLLNGKETVKTIYTFNDFSDFFKKEFAFLGKNNVHISEFKLGKISALLYIKGKEFDLKQLDKFQIQFTEKPNYRARLCEIMILE